MKTVVLLLVLLCTSCNPVFFIATGKTKEPVHVANPMDKAIEVAITKYLLDDSWTMVEVQKEIDYQLYKQRTE